MRDLLQTPWHAIQMVLAFAAVIFIHELGHFLAAKRNGVRVLKFAIGFDFFGVKLFSRTVGGTEYVVGAFPLGGYVRMLGQEDLPTDAEEEAGAIPPDSFQAKSVWQRMEIISAGVAANFASAFLFCWLAFVSGFQMTTPEVGSVGFESLRAGLRSGDRIVSIDGTRVASWQDVQILYGTAEPGARIRAEVERGGERVPLDLSVLRDPASPLNQPDFGPATSLQITEVREATAEGPTAAKKAGIRPGDVLVSVDGRPLDSWQTFSRLARAHAGVPMRIALDRPRDRESTAFDRVEVTLVPGRIPDEYSGAYRLGADSGEPARVDVVLPGHAGAEAGLAPGDTVVAVDGSPVGTWHEFWRRAEYAPRGVPLALRVRGADGSERDVAVVPGPADHWHGLGVWGVFALGIAHRAPDEARIGRLEPDSPAARAGLRPGDRIAAVRLLDAPEGSGIDPQKALPVDGWSDVALVVARAAGPRAEFTYEREGARATAAVDLAPDPEPRWRGFVGVGTGEKTVWVARGPIEAIRPALRQPFMILEQLWLSLKALVLGRVGTELLSGPVGIGRAIWYAAEQSLGELFNLVAVISINLAVVNFLPIPITDGGHFLFLVYERFRGRRVNEEIQARLQWAGLVFLLLVFVFATWNDLSNLLLR